MRKRDGETETRNLKRERERKEDREKIKPKRDEEIRAEKKDADIGRGNRGNEKQSERASKWIWRNRCGGSGMFIPDPGS
jgi:hypothetical protein